MKLTDKNEKLEQARRFEQLYRETYAKMLRAATAALNTPSPNSTPVSGRAEEAVQELFVTAWKRRDALFASESPEGWLYKALAYKVKELVREDWNWVKKTDRLTLHRDGQEDMIPSELGLYDLLGAGDYELLQKLYLEGYTYQEVSAQMGVKTSTLATRVQRIKERFRKKF